ncbi:MAG: DUF262 domain-containing protein, partial [Gammaproteobacteria bacterium]|nr:DUF262 domain-containing protein [Gammaproteobacteria bacterium]
MWQDIEELACTIIDKGDTDAHFMGAVVIQLTKYPSVNMERRRVVDGQQRLTTIQLLIDAIQEVLEDRQHTKPARRLASLVLNAEEFRDEKNPDSKFKVWPTVTDREAFRHAMSNELSDSATYPKSQIVQAHKYFKDQTADWLDGFGDIESCNKAAEALEKIVRTKLDLVVIDLESSDDPHLIFETLNARGTPLLESDMVKNKILHESNIHLEDEKESSEETKRLWPFDKWWAEEVGLGLQRRPRIDVYLNHWLTLKNKSQTKSYDEFAIFEEFVKIEGGKGKSISNIAEDLGEIGRTYRNMEEGSIQDIRAFLTRRSAMNVGAVTPLLLWLLSSNVPRESLRASVKALESFLVRRVICGYSTRSYGKLFVDAIKELAKLPLDSVHEALAKFLGKQESQAAVWPGDSELLERFATAPLYKKLTRGRLRMVLAGIEEQLRTSKAEVQQVPSGIQIEHIMPQGWQEYWPLPDTDDKVEAFERRERMIHTIGNLTLVNGKLNSALSNA